MKQFYLFLILLFIPVIATPQQISVKSFRLLEYDLDARVHHPRRDQNGEICAIIKVVTTQSGFTFDVGSLGVVATEPKTGEIWVYVPRGVQRITIGHSQLGVLRNYAFNIPIQSATVYELELVTARVTTVVEDALIETQWLAVNSTPQGANLFVDDRLVGTTPYTGQFPEGEYTYRIELPRYHTEAGRVSLRDSRETLNFELRPRYGNIRVTSSPENGMMIYLNDENTGQTTPATLAEVSSGSHTVRLMSQWYQPQGKTVTVTDNETTHATFTLEPAFANITINTHPPADIYIDDRRIAAGSHTTRMLAGIYNLKAELDKHHPELRQISIEPGQSQNISFQLSPQTGRLEITSTPFDARITLNGEDYGTTPTTIRDLIIGNYTLILEKQGYGTVTKSVTIAENQTAEVNETLPSGKDVTITSTPVGAQLSINGTLVGSTPYTTSLSFSRYALKLVKGETIVERTIDITQDGQTRWEFDVWGIIPTVTNPITGKTWMDRNLGASRAATSSTDAQSYGDLYQWGRAADGHQKRNSGTSTALSSSDTPGYENFILAPSSPHDWRSPQNTNLWQGVNGTNNPCPSGYRLPTDAELDAERLSWSSNNAAGAFSSPLKLTLAGLRDGSNGSLFVVGFAGGYWSSTVDGIRSRSLSFGSSGARMGSSYRADGYSVRCLKD